jgi:aryl-alcohol dehydrogenase-like predicted oxidoreductase
MKFRTLGKTNLRTSVIGVGTWQFGGEWGKAFTAPEAHAILSRACDLGINLIDTAECYGDHLSESLIGDYLAASNARDHWIIATKFGHKFHSHLSRTEPRTPHDVEIQLNDSLRALRTDYIDLYQYHSWADSQFESEAVHEFLLRAKAAGKIRHIGNSVGPNNKPHQISLSEKFHVEAIQIIYNRLQAEPEKEIFPLCLRENLGILARVPLASGYLSGNYRPGTTFTDPADVRSSHKPEVVQERLAIVEQIKQRELPPNATMPQYALAWCLKHPAVTCVIPGCKSVEQVESNAKAAEL